MKKLCIGLLLLSYNIMSYGQLIVNQNLTPAQLVSQILIGYGVSVSNVTYTGDLLAIGNFLNGGTTNIGLNDGVIMTSGNATIAIGPNNSGSAGYNNTGVSDPQLASLVTTSIYDAAVLEFDFIPIADTVRFEYVFGSDEYPEYSGSNYNDVFGFFISGPNPSGGNYSNVNMALLPNSSTVVSINNINNGTSNTGPCTNCSYYINNMGGYTIQYDGISVVLSAWKVVTPCVTYHFKAAIGDAGDGAFDSGVFLKAGSFSTNAVQISTDFTVAGAIQKGIEGCNNVEIKATLPKVLSYAYVVNIDTMWGTATNGVDFPFIADSIVVPAGQLSASLILQPIVDYIAEGEEYWNMIFQTSPCTIDTVVIPIVDYIPIQFSAHQNDTMVCSDSLLLKAYPINGWSPYIYDWTPSADITHPNSNSTFANPQQTTQFIVGVSDSSGCPLKYDTINIEVNEKVQPSFTVDLFQGCEPLAVQFTDLSTPVISDWKWYFGDGDSSDVQSPSHIYAAGDYGVTLIANTAEGCNGKLTVPNLIHSWPMPNVDFYLNPSVVTVDNPTINFVNTSTSSPGYNYLWNFGDGGTANTFDATHTYVNDQAGYTVWLIVTTDKGCVDSISYIANVIVDEIVVPNVITPNGDGLNDFFEIENIEKLESSSLVIYNRWGKKVFESTNYQNNWNGDGAADGVYYWFLEYKTYFRESSEKGTVTIIGSQK